MTQNREPAISEWAAYRQASAASPEAATGDVDPRARSEKPTHIASQAPAS